MRPSLLAGMIVVGVSTWSCGGSSSSNPAGPAAGNTTTTVSIIGQRGAQSFSPNPAPIAQGSMFVFHNQDNTVHHIVMNDGSLDVGEIAPGASSPALRMGTDGANYHCTIHPTMIGSINRSTGNPPQCDGPYC